jgi:hypothetical protein
MDLHIHSPIRLHGIVLNSLSTGTTFLTGGKAGSRTIIFFIPSGVRLSPLGTAATSGLLYQPQ